MQLTQRLRSSLIWFVEVLDSEVCRRVRYLQPKLENLALLYTDAESNGEIAAVLVNAGLTYCWTASVEPALKKKLHHRHTQIVAYELLAAIMGLIVCDSRVGLECRLIHFIDAEAALKIVVKGASRQSDLNSLVAYLWLSLSRRQVTYWARHVSSVANLADGPSRGKFEIMKKLSAERVNVSPPDLLQAFDKLSSPRVPESFAW